MLLSDEVVTPKRRRGAVLEQALLEAAWAELGEHGYAGFTMEAVAARAGTSTPVLYRRWPGRRDLATAALRFKADQNPISLPDTGSLRTDLMAYLQIGAAERGEVTVLFVMRMAEFFNEVDLSPAAVLDQLVSGQVSLLDVVYERAIARGEINPETLTSRRRSLPMDLLRNELMMTRRAIPRKVIVEMVDEILLPLLTSGGAD